jgi:hypothetical protein
MVSSGSATPGSGDYKTPPGCQGLGFSGGNDSLGRASDGGVPRRATGDVLP